MFTRRMLFLGAGASMVFCKARRAIGQTLTFEQIGGLRARLYCADEEYLYGRTDALGGQTLARFHVADHTEAARGYNFGPGNAFIHLWTTSLPGEVFAMIRRSDATYTLHRSSNYGATFVRVLAFGDNGSGGQIPNVRLLNRGLAEVFINGIRMLLAAEYNVYSNRQPGTLTDRVRIMKSTDGVRWSQLYAFNTHGVHHTRHIHMVAQDPVTKWIYFGLGDGNKELGIIAWNGTANWPTTSIAPSAFKTRLGFRAATEQRKFWITDMLFPRHDGFVYAGMEGTLNPRQPAEEGIWRYSTDLSLIERVYPTSGQSFRGTGIRLGVLAKRPNGEVQIWSDVGGIPGQPNHTEFYLSQENNFEPGAWKKAGPWYYLSGTSYHGGYGFFTAGGKIYFSSGHRNVTNHTAFYRIR